MYEKNFLVYRVKPMPEPKKTDDNHFFRSSPQRQLYFHITYTICHRDFAVTGDGRQICTSHEHVEPVTVPFWTNISLFNIHRPAFDKFTQRLAQLGIDSEYQQRLASDAIEIAKGYTNGGVSEEEKKVLRFSLNIVMENKQYYDELDVLDLVEMESMVEYENRNYGMVPAAPDSLRMLRSVKLKGESEGGGRGGGEEGETCCVCLEEFGDFAKAMPCNHLFHHKCIVKWLRTNHVCPVCRFQMPVD